MFNEDLGGADASNFSIAGLSVEGAEYDEDRTVVISTAVQTLNKVYTVEFTGLDDVAGNTSSGSVDIKAVHEFNENSSPHSDDTLYIELEDFNYDGGEWMTFEETDGGGAYEGLEFVKDIDIHNGGNASPNYRVSDDNHPGMNPISMRRTVTAATGTWPLTSRWAGTTPVTGTTTQGTSRPG